MVNIFQLIGDLLNLLSFIIIIYKIRRDAKCTGVSAKTQEIYLIVFCTRYMDHNNENPLHLCYYIHPFPYAHQTPIQEHIQPSNIRQFPTLVPPSLCYHNDLNHSQRLDMVGHALVVLPIVRISCCVSSNFYSSKKQWSRRVHCALLSSFRKL